MIPDDRQQLQHVIDQFVGGGKALVQELGAGNINVTYLVTTARQSFVLQRINHQVFPDPIAVAENFTVIVQHLEERQRQLGTHSGFAGLLPTREGGSWFQDDVGEVWRAQKYLTGRPLARINNAAQATEVGLALGRFHHLIGDLAVERVQEPLPGFHVLPAYLQEFDRLNGGFLKARDATLRHCLAMVEDYRDMAPLLQQAGAQGILQTRIIHGDPKLDNFLFDAAQKRVVSLIDLDTVGPGLLHYDLGDCLRSCCNRGGEGGDPLKVRFDMDTCRAWLEGYCRQMGESLSRHDREYLYEAVLLISFELGLRFFTDHLRGDTYFKVRREGENLQRALVQFALVGCIAKQEAGLRALLCICA